MTQARPSLEHLAEWASSVSGNDLRKGHARAGDAILDTLGLHGFRPGLRFNRHGACSRGPLGRGALLPLSGTAASFPRRSLLWSMPLRAIARTGTITNFPDRPIPASCWCPPCWRWEKNAGRAALPCWMPISSVWKRSSGSGEACGISLYSRGWHATSTIGAVGAAAACARLLGSRQGGNGSCIGAFHQHGLGLHQPVRHDGQTSALRPGGKGRHHGCRVCRGGF